MQSENNKKRGSRVKEDYPNDTYVPLDLWEDL
jgi:hypothetical protein